MGMRVLTVLCCAHFSWLAFAGDLIPPGGPSPTMKPLDQIEPRTPIDILPYAITAPGSYYLTKNLGPGAEGFSGIVIQADNVSIDLCGFTLLGPGKESTPYCSGIVASAANSNISVTNGTVSGWSGSGVELESPSARIIQVRAIENAIGISGNAKGCVIECICERNSSAGISNGGAVINNISNNNMVGINVGELITGNQCAYNQIEGIRGDYRSLVTNNVAQNNGGDGIYVFGGSNVSGNSCSSNQGDGIEATTGVAISNNSCAFNYEDGIQAEASCRITGNTCTDNGSTTDNGAGVHVTGSQNVLKENHCTGNDRGLDVDDAANYSAQNTLANNTTNVEGTHTQGIGDLANVSF